MSIEEPSASCSGTQALDSRETPPMEDFVWDGLVRRRKWARHLRASAGGNLPAAIDGPQHETSAAYAMDLSAASCLRPI